MTKCITVAICTFNRYDVLESAIESCLSQNFPPDDYEIIVVDNSPDATLKQQYADQFASVENLTYVCEQTPGLSNARNVALNLSDAKYIAYLDDDAIADDIWLSEIRRGFEDITSNVGVVGGCIEPIWEIRRPEWIPSEYEGMFSVVNWGGETRVAEPGEWFAGANISFDVNALKAIGGFDTNLGRNGSSASLLSNEESVVCEALAQAGHQLVYAPMARVRHLVEKKRISREWMRKRQAWQAVSDFIGNKARGHRQAEEAWHGVAAFYAALPPRYRNSSGLFRDFDDVELTRKQLDAVYNFNILLLSGAANVDDYHYDV